MKFIKALKGNKYINVHKVEVFGIEEMYSDYTVYAYAGHHDCALAEFSFEDSDKDQAKSKAQAYLDNLIAELNGEPTDGQTFSRS